MSKAKNAAVGAARARTRAPHGRSYEKNKAYTASGTPVALAYAKRRAAATARACHAWCARNGDARRRSRKLQSDIAGGAVTRPADCQDCGQPPRGGRVPVAWRDNDDEIAAWLCWKCYWVRKRERDAAESTRADDKGLARA